MQQLTPQIAGAYYGCEVFTLANGQHPLPMSRIMADCIGVAGNWVDMEQCKLALTPPSKISGQDAIEVAKMMGIIDPGCPEEDFAYWGNYAKKTYILTRKVSIKVLDFLRASEWNGRSKDAIDMGYGEIPSLIAAGMAVDKTGMG